MPWPLDETYTFTRRELAALLEETCWNAIEELLHHQSTHPAEGLFPPEGLVDGPVHEAIDGLFLQQMG